MSPLTHTLGRALFGQPVDLTLGTAELNREVSTVDVGQLAEALLERYV